MDTTKKGILYLSVLCAVGSVRSQTDVRTVCSPAVWTLREKVVLQCFLQKSSYPVKCVTSNGNSTIFRQSNDGVTFTPNCTLTDILGACTSSGGCRCGTPNATHYIFEYEFEATEDRQGYWDCNVPCFDGFTPLTSSKYDCDNKKTIKIPEPENCKAKVGGAAGGGVACGVAAGGLAAVLYYLFGKDKIRCLQYKKGKQPPKNDEAIKDLKAAAKIVMAQVQGVFIYTVFDIQNVVYVMILGTKPPNLDKAEKKMLSTVQILEKCPVPKESREPGDSRDPKPDYPGSNAPGP